MAQLLASVNSLPTDAAGAKRSGRAQGMPFVTTPDASSERPAGAPASLDELELQRLLESMSHSGSGRGGEEGGDAEPPLSPELRQLLQRMSKPCRGSAQEEELHPELAKLLQKMSAPGTSRAKEENELPPELARLLEQMNGPSRVQAAAPDEESNPELDLLIERMSCASTATARGPSASMAGSSLAGSRAGSAVGSRGPSLATSPQPSRDAESDRFDAERSYLESQEGQMLLAAGVPRDEILASLPSHSGTAPAEGAGGGQPTAPEKAVLPVVNRPPTASTPVASPGVTAPGGASHAAGGALALKVEALRLKQAGDVPGAIAKMREAKALEAAALATQVGEGSSPLAGGGAKSSPSLPDSACRVAAQGKSSPHSSSNGQPTTSSPHTVQTGSAPPALDDRNVSKAGTKMAIGSRTASPASTEQESARSSAASPSPASSASESVAAHVATLKREAVQLKRAGDIVGATAKLRQARAVEAGAAKPAANVAAEAAHVTAIARAASVAAAAMDTVAILEQQEAEAEVGEGAEAGAEAEAEQTTQSAGTDAGATKEPGGAGSAAGAEPSATASLRLSEAGDEDLRGRIAMLKQEALAHKRAGRPAEAITALREAKRLQLLVADGVEVAASGAAAPPMHSLRPAAPLAPPAQPDNIDLSKLEIEVTLLSASLTIRSGTTTATYARFSWDLVPGGGGARLECTTTPAMPGLKPVWRHRAVASFGADPRRSRAAIRHISTTNAIVEAWGTPGGFGRIFGAREVLIGVGEARLAPLLEATTVTCNVMLHDPQSNGLVNVGHVAVQLRVRTPIGRAPAPSPRGGLPSTKPGPQPAAAPAPLSARARAAAAATVAEDEDDMTFVNSLVSYNVLSGLIEDLKARRAALEAKGTIVPLSFESRLQALELRKDMIQIQVQTPALPMPAVMPLVHAPWRMGWETAICAQCAVGKAPVGMRRSTWWSRALAHHPPFQVSTGGTQPHRSIQDFSP